MKQPENLGLVSYFVVTLLYWNEFKPYKALSCNDKICWIWYEKN
jgi:hypothetical protein